MPAWSYFFLRQLRDIFITFAISIFITYFFVGDALFASFLNLVGGSLYGFIVGITIWKGSNLLTLIVDRIFPWEKKPVRTLVISVISSVIYCALAIIVVNIIFYEYYYNKPVLSIFNDFRLQMIVQMGIAMFISTLYYISRFFTFWRQAAVNEERYKQEALSLQYETLKSYVNPHFLFNSLSVLSSLVEKDVPKSQLFIRQLSDIYRYVLEQKNKEVVPLETELAFAGSFIELHKIRHGANLKVDFRVDDRSGYTVPLSMQILLENAFKHNVISEEEPLEINIWRDHDYIIVQNRIQRRTVIQPQGGTGTGLESVSKQFEYLTSRSLLINGDDGYFTVYVPVIDADVLNNI